ncbi:iron chaperone [Negadavirga shengliensis]|uniref:Iron chaperone n=1 Tax=Negadavirga shengliensis TaxID=1389218 RepID=A0ABV9T261_9BACT
MSATDKKAESISEYIAGFPQETQRVLEEIRATIKNVVPEAEESISYGMPTFNLHGHYLVYFAAYKKHIGFYPVPVENDFFKQELSSYKTGKGSVQFPLAKPMPLDLIVKIVQFRVKVNLEKRKKQK